MLIVLAARGERGAQYYHIGDFFCEQNLDLKVFFVRRAACLCFGWWETRAHLPPTGRGSEILYSRQPGSDESGGSVVGTWAAMNAAPGAIWLPAGPQPAAYSHCQKAHYGVGNQHSPGRHQFDASSRRPLSRLRRVLSIAGTLDI